MKLNGSFILNPNLQQTHKEKIKKAQMFVDSDCIRLMVPYTPMLNGKMFQSATNGTVIGSGEIKYTSPYARYQYYGKVMVSSVTGSPWARKGESKVFTERNINYNKSRNTKAGSYWFERMKADRKDQILMAAQRLLK